VRAIPVRPLLRLFVGIVSVALFALGFSETNTLQPPQEKGTLPTNPPTPYIHYISHAEPHRRALVVHGLDSNKEFMQIFSSALADAGVEVYAIDLPGHGDSSAGFNGLLATSALEQAISVIKPDIAVGHSMGAALLIDLAHDVKFRDLILISPAPTEVNAPEFQHTPVTTEGWDLPFVNTFALQLEGVELRKFKWGMHSSALVNPLQIRDIVAWLGGNPDALHTTARLVWLGIMFAAGIAFAFVLFPSQSAGAVNWGDIVAKEHLYKIRDCRRYFAHRATVGEYFPRDSFVCDGLSDQLSVCRRAGVVDQLDVSKYIDQARFDNMDELLESDWCGGLCHHRFWLADRVAPYSRDVVGRPVVAFFRHCRRFISPFSL
jgi:pimeloyl-ACP methyl ester carboxylesterase